MLYDVFICHASEDKDGFVRPLAEALRKEHLEVWYDEFSLRLGDSIRQAIDKGLRQSRFGIVVLSPSFFEKSWTQYELDGLNERQMQGRDTVLLPVWHRVTHSEVMAYSPSLAGRLAAQSSGGIEQVLKQVLSVVRPKGSPFIEARDTLLEWGVTPPVITDEYWLDVVEASNRIPAYGAHIPEESTWGIWSFPLPSKEGGARGRGTRLAWTAMQMNWTSRAERDAICPITAPDQVHEFIEACPGLLETCEDYPGLVAEYAPQLTIPGFEGSLEKSVEEAFEASCRQREVDRERNPKFGAGLTTDGTGPLCDEEWSCRHPSFGNLHQRIVAHAYFGGSMFGPTVSPFRDSEHLFWLLSPDSSWLPTRIHDVLLQGLGNSLSWVWKDGDHHPDKRYENPFFHAMYKACESGKAPRWTRSIEADLRERISYAIKSLRLSIPESELLQAFMEAGIVEMTIRGEAEMRAIRRRRASPTAPKKSNGTTGRNSVRTKTSTS